MHKIEIRRSTKDKGWYWHIKARNGRVVNTGGEGFYSRYTAAGSIRSWFTGVLKTAGVPTGHYSLRATVFDGTGTEGEVIDVTVR